MRNCLAAGLRPLMLFFILLGLTAAVAGLQRAEAASRTPVIAAASDLQFALQEIAARFQEETGYRVRLSFGSSGNFTRQIEQGAPFELFLSADEAFVFRLADGGYTIDRGTRYARGRIVLFASHNSPVTVDPALDGVRAALESGELRRFAIANPHHAPYGRAAREALESLDLWQALQPHLVQGENAAQAAQFAASRAAQAGIMPSSIARSGQVGARGNWVLLPEALHEPLEQRMVLLEGAGLISREFYGYMQAPAAREILERYGFSIPQD